MAIVLVELIYGFLANSMALIADGGHNLSDVLGLVEMRLRGGELLQCRALRREALTGAVNEQAIQRFLGVRGATGGRCTARRVSPTTGAPPTVIVNAVRHYGWKLFAALAVVLGALAGRNVQQGVEPLDGLACHQDRAVEPVSVCLALTHTLAPVQIYAWMDVVFAAVMIGGLGSAMGPLLAGFLIGISEALTMAVTAPTWAPLVSFSLLIAIILFRPARF